MKINNILSVFTPKDVKFLPLLKSLAEVMVHSGKLLDELLNTKEFDEWARIALLIKEDETKGDKISAQILKELNNTFITPFDREDIDALNDRLESVLDSINKVSQKILLYRPHKLPEHTRFMGGLVKKATLEAQGAVNALDHLRKSDSSFRKYYKEIKRLEEEADVIYEQAIIDLFQNEKDTIEVIKLKEVIQELEKSANRINSVGKVLKTIFVKYA